MCLANIKAEFRELRLTRVMYRMNIYTSPLAILSLEIPVQT